jgi:hypothetical protein
MDLHGPCKHGIKDSGSTKGGKMTSRATTSLPRKILLDGLTLDSDGQRLRTLETPPQN